MKKAAFMARLWPGSSFLGSLISMREISTLAALIVRNGEIELRICNGGCTSLASLVLQASTMLPPSADCFALRFDVNALARELVKFLEGMNASSRTSEQPNRDDKPRHGALLEDKTLWIYKMSNSDELCFLIGLNPNPLRLKPVFEAHLQSDLRILRLLPVKITLKSECFRELLDTFAPEPVDIFLFDDAVTWQQPSKNVDITYRNPLDCSSVGALEGRPRRLAVDFMQTKALFHASHVSKTVVIHPLAKGVLGSWILVLFPIDRNSFFAHLVRGLSLHETATELKVFAESDEQRRRLMARFR